MDQRKLYVSHQIQIYQDIYEDRSQKFNEEYCKVLSQRTAISPLRDCKMTDHLDCSAVKDVGTLGCEAIEGSW